MIVLLRLLFGAAMLYVLALTISAADSGSAGDVAPALYVALCVIVGLANAIVWTPWIGGKIADPLTSVFTADSASGKPNAWLRFARFAEARRWRRLALVTAFCEGVRHPDQPGAFNVGLRAAKPGSWLEKIFATEVYRFDNARNSVRAYQILKAHGKRPPPHRNKEISGVLMSLDRSQRPKPAVLTAPKASSPAPERNRSIKLPRLQPDNPSSSSTKNTPGA